MARYKLVKQHNLCGCAVACVAFVLSIRYDRALRLFENGLQRADFKGFYCRDIINALAKGGLSYDYKYVNPKTRRRKKWKRLIIKWSDNFNIKLQRDIGRPY